MAKYINHRACKQAVFFLISVIIVLLGGESPVIPASASIPQMIQGADGSGQQITQQTPFVVGEVEQQTARISYQRQAIKGQTITYPGASFIKVHFQTLDLMPGDYVTVSDPTGGERYMYPGSESTSDDGPGFWSMSISGDTAIVQLHSQLSSSSLSKSGFVIDKYGRGYPQAEIERILPMSTCGASQRQDVACYQETNPTEFDKSNAVARLLINYPDGFYAFCTAWRVGVGPNMLTNQHCLDSQTAVAASEAWFNYQNQSCNVSSIGNVTKVTGNSLLTSDLALDFALFTVNNAESIRNFGYLEIDPRTPEAGEQIYIPQHGGGNPKQFGIESDSNEGNVCRIDVPVMDGLDNGTDTGYYCDTTGGSSGAPVLASSSNKVSAIHHFGSSSPPVCTTPNQGVRMDLIWPQVEPYLLQVSPFGSIDNYNPIHTWNEVSGATWYYLWVDGPSGNLIKQWYKSSDICNTGICSVSPNVTLSGGIYQWWVQTWNDAGYGPWSSGLTFRTAAPESATLVSPNSNIGTNSPTYIWNQVSGATWYYLWVDGPSRNVLRQWYTTAQASCNGTTCSVANATPNLAAEEYTWKVQTWNDAGYGPWSDTLTFAAIPPGQAILTSPTGSIGTNTPTYIWNEVSGATWYYLWINGPSGTVFKQWYTAAQANCDGSTCSVTPAGLTLGNGNYTWWIQTWSGAGYGPWSEGMSFRPTVPGKTSLVSPTGSIRTNTPTYTWNEVSGATWHYLWVNGPSGTVIQQWYTAAQANCNGSTCSVTPSTTLSRGAHSWWIQTWNSAGYGPWSNRMDFTVIMPN